MQDEWRTDNECSVERVARWTTYVLAACLLGAFAFADDYQCRRDAGCQAFESTEEGTIRRVFKKGDIISTSNGWIVNPADGWTKVYSFDGGASAMAAAFGPSGVGVVFGTETIEVSGSGIGSGPSSCALPLCAVYTQTGFVTPWGPSSSVLVLIQGDILELGTGYYEPASPGWVDAP